MHQGSERNVLALAFGNRSSFKAAKMACVLNIISWSGDMYLVFGRELPLFKPPYQEIKWWSVHRITISEAQSHQASPRLIQSQSTTAFHYSKLNTKLSPHATDYSHRSSGRCDMESFRARAYNSTQGALTRMFPRTITSRWSDDSHISSWGQRVWK